MNATPEIDRQIDALEHTGIPRDRIYVDKKSGATTDRPGLREVIAYAREGEVIVGHTLDRLGRTVRDTLNLIHELRSDGADVHDGARCPARAEVEVATIDQRYLDRRAPKATDGLETPKASANDTDAVPLVASAHGNSSGSTSGIGARSSTRPERIRTAKHGCGRVAGPWTIAPSARRKML